MGLARLYRLSEGSLVLLFTLQALRLVYATLSGMIPAAVSPGQSKELLLYGLILVATQILPWFAPRRRAALPEALSLSAIAAACARLVMSTQAPLVQIVAGLLVIGLGGFYLASLVHANWRALAAALTSALVLDQLMRASDTYDPSLRAALELSVAGTPQRVLWAVIQLALGLGLIVVSRLARRSAKREPYEPADLPLVGGLALGGLLMVQVCALGLPNVLARWTGVPYAVVVPWLALATALPLLPAARALMDGAFSVFDPRLSGWVWLLVLVMLVVLGGRASGPGAAGALIMAQFMLVLSLWSLARPLDPSREAPRRSSSGIAFVLSVLLAGVYAFALEQTALADALRGQGFVVLLLAAALTAVPRLLRRAGAVRHIRAFAARGTAAAFVAPAVVLSLILSGLAGVQRPAEAPGSLRVATYNINGGFDAEGTVRLDLAARTIEASLADIVVLQEAEVGRPRSFGIDQVEYLARRLDMHSAFLPVGDPLRGVAVLSRWPLSSPSGVTVPSLGGDSAALRVELQTVLVEQPIIIVAAQLRAAEDEQRVQQAAVLLELIADASLVLLGADLGAPPQDMVYQQLISEGFSDPDQVLGIEQGYTTPAVYPTVRHDYVLARGLTPLDARQVDSAASDHRLVVVEFGLPGS